MLQDGFRYFMGADIGGLAELMPSGDEIAVLVEKPDATVEAIGNLDVPQGTAERDIARIVEIAGRRSFVAPGLDEAAILREFEDAAGARGIAAMAIGNKKSPLAATATPVGRSKTSVPLPPTPICQEH
jgi:hypothetical protein